MSDRPVDAGTPVDPTAARVEPVAADALADDVSAASFGGYVRLWWQGIRAGELGSLPIIVGLLVISVPTLTAGQALVRGLTFTGAAWRSLLARHDLVTETGKPCAHR